MKNLRYILFNSLTLNVILCLAFAAGYIFSIIANEKMQTVLSLTYIIPVISVIILLAIINFCYAIKLFNNKVIIRNYDPNGGACKGLIMFGFAMVAITMVAANLVMLILGAIFINCLNNNFIITALIVAIIMLIPPILLTGGQTLLMARSILNQKSEYQRDYLTSLKLSSNDPSKIFLIVSKYNVLTAFIDNIIIKLVDGIPFVFYKNKRFSIKIVAEYLKLANTEILALNDDDFKIIEMMDI